MSRRARLLLLLLCSGATFAYARQFHVSADAKNGDGSRLRPWRLEVAFAHPRAVRPGDTVWVHGGMYRGPYASVLTGTGDRPIIIRAFPGERVTIDGGRTDEPAVLTVRGSFAWYWGFEIMTSDPRRVSAERGSYPRDILRPECATVAQELPVWGVKFINLVLHDGRGGWSAWKPTEDTEVYGCVMYNNGWLAPDRPHGHNIYTQNERSTKRFAENILCHAFSHNVQVYGSDSASLNNYVFEGNIIFSGGERNFLIGGGRKGLNNRFVGNFLFEPSGGNIFNLGHYPWGHGVEKMTVTDNYMIGGEISFKDVTQEIVEDNTIYAEALVGLSKARYPKNTWYKKMPDDLRVSVRANYYEKGRGNIVVYNGGKNSVVSADVSSILSPGDSYMLVDAENYFGPPVLQGKFDGKLLEIPMVQRQAAVPVGLTNPPAHTPPIFGAFVLLRK
jgi:hypothetical protein